MRCIAAGLYGMKLDAVGNGLAFAGGEQLHARLLGQCAGESGIVRAAEPGLQADEGPLGIGPYGKERELLTEHRDTGRSIRKSDADRADLAAGEDPGVGDVCLIRRCPILQGQAVRLLRLPDLSRSARAFGILSRDRCALCFGPVEHIDLRDPVVLRS